jgi:hypothetical protein
LSDNLVNRMSSPFQIVAAAQPPRLLDPLRNRFRLRHYSLRTEQAYVHRMKRYIMFHGKRHPAEVGKAEVEAFLTRLAVERHVAASTQTLSALLFLEVLSVDLPWLSEWTRAKRPTRLPTMRTREELRRLLRADDRARGRCERAGAHSAALRLRLLRRRHSLNVIQQKRRPKRRFFMTLGSWGHPSPSEGFVLLSKEDYRKTGVAPPAASPQAPAFARWRQAWSNGSV